jgi:inosose dehydratase
MNRRDLLTSGALATTALALGIRPLRAQKPDMRFGYAAITWGGNDLQAIDDIAALGFRGIQLRSSALEKWGDRPEVLRALLAERDLTLVALSSGTVRLGPGVEAEDLELHVANARFLRAVGGLYLQVLDERPKGRAPTSDDFKRMGHLFTEIGKRTADLGIPLGYHNHMGNLGQAPHEVAQVLDAADPRYVKLELDTAHYQQGGGDPAEAVNTFGDRLLFLHVKDLESPVPGKEAESYRFVELGRGKVDFPKVFAALERVGFEGWGIIELDSVPDSARTPKESGEIARQYLEAMGFQL